MSKRVTVPLTNTESRDVFKRLIEFVAESARESNEALLEESVNAERESDSEFAKNVLLLTLGKDSLPMSNDTFLLAKEITGMRGSAFEREDFCLFLKEQISIRTRRAHDIREAIIREEYEAVYAPLFEMAKKREVIHKNCDVLEAVSKVMPDDFVIARMDAEARTTLIKLKAMANSGMKPANLGVDALKEAVAKRIDEIKSLIPNERIVRHWQNQNARDWIGVLREAIK